MDRDGKIATVRCRAALDVGVEAVYVGVAPGYRLEKTAIGAEAALDERRGGWVERVLEEVRRGFSGLPVYVGVEEGYVKKTAPMDQRQFKRYLETCKKLGFRFDRRGGEVGQAAGGAEGRLVEEFSFSAVPYYCALGRLPPRLLHCACPGLRRADPG